MLLIALKKINIIKKSHVCLSVTRTNALEWVCNTLIFHIEVNWLHLHHCLTKTKLIKWWVSRNKLETITFTISCNYSPWVYFFCACTKMTYLWHLPGTRLHHGSLGPKHLSAALLTSLLQTQSTKQQCWSNAGDAL